MRNRSGFAAVLLMALLATAGLDSTARAQQVVITTRDGRTLRGELVSKDSNRVVLRLEGGEQNVPTSEIAAMQVVKSIGQQYNEKRAALRDDDLEGRYQLARWLVDNRAYDLARTELSDLLRRKPDDGRLASLMKLIDAAQQQAQTPPPAAQTQPAPAPPVGPTAPPPAATAPVTTDDPLGLHVKRLSDEQLNLIRVYEIDLTLRPAPRVIIPREVGDALFAEYGQNGQVGGFNRARFTTLSGAEQLKLMFGVKARSLYSKVTVPDDPPALRTFRTRIYEGYVLNYCASAQCHGGGPGSAKLFLLSSRARDLDTVYTNFYILHRYKRDLDYMIDTGAPDRSLLVQYGLPAEAAALKHPDVAGRRPSPALSLGEKSPMYRILVDWMRQELVPREALPNANYPIDYPSPVLAPPKQP